MTCPLSGTPLSASVVKLPPPPPPPRINIQFPGLKLSKSHVYIINAAFLHIIPGDVCIQSIDYVLYRSANYSMCLSIDNYIK